MFQTANTTKLCTNGNFCGHEAFLDFEKCVFQESLVDLIRRFMSLPLTVLWLLVYKSTVVLLKHAFHQVTRCFLSFSF